MVNVDITKKHGHRPIVVFPRDRIELVVVTSGTVHRESHEPLESCANDVVQILIAVVRVVLFTKPDSGPNPVIAGGYQADEFPSFKLITGQLLKNEPIKRLIVVEGFNDVVAIAPGIGKVLVMFETGAVSIAGHVEPETSPALAIVRRLQQPIDQVFVGPRRGVADKSLHFLWRR